METTLFILENPFKDENLSDEDYLCWQCVLLEGVLAKFPQQLSSLNVKRVGFSRPRVDVIAQVGGANQSLPTLVLGEGILEGQETGSFEGRRFIKGKDEILAALNQIYNIPHVHP